MAQLGFYINQSLCTGCKACGVSCKHKSNLNVGINFRRVYTYEEGSFIKQPTGGIVHNIKAFYFQLLVIIVHNQHAYQAARPVRS